MNIAPKVESLLQLQNIIEQYISAKKPNELIIEITSAEKELLNEQYTFIDKCPISNLVNFETYYEEISIRTNTRICFQVTKEINMDT